MFMATGFFAFSRENGRVDLEHSIDIIDVILHSRFSPP